GYPTLPYPPDAETRNSQVVRLYQAVEEGDRFDQGQGTDHDLQIQPAPSGLLPFLGRMLRGWANYFRHGASKATFSAVDSYAWERIASWLRRKHRLGWPALKRRFCV